MSGPVPWDEISESAQDAVADIIELLAERFTGEITLHCKDGDNCQLKLSGGKGVISQLKEARRLRRALTDPSGSD